jgi:hypothetical protein
MVERTLRKSVFARFRLKLVKSQLKNKLDNMKKDYTVFMELKNATTELGWDDANQTVDCSNMWWDEHLAVSPCQIVDIFSLVHYILIYIHFPAHLFNNDATSLREVSSVSMSSSESVDRSTLMICIYCLIRCMSPGLQQFVQEIFPLVNQVMNGDGEQ